MTNQRTEAQRAADEIDCDLYRLIARVERLYDGNKRHHCAGEVLKSLQGLRGARFGIRLMMHEQDCKETA